MKAYHAISGVIFLVVGIAHLMRAVFAWSVNIGDWTVPQWISWPVAIVFAALAITSFSLLNKSRST